MRRDETCGSDSLETARKTDDQPREGGLIWDFLQRYDESWIWRCADRRQVTESARNFAALEECMEDAVRHGYVPERTRPRRQQAQSQRRRARGQRIQDR